MRTRPRLLNNNFVEILSGKTFVSTIANKITAIVGSI